MNIIISNAKDSPIYEQITNQIKQQIISGCLPPGEPLPSMRALARELQISVITTKRAYEDLEREGFVATIQGKGTFVAEVIPEFLVQQQRKTAIGTINEAVRQAKDSQMSLEEILGYVEQAYAAKQKREDTP